MSPEEAHTEEPKIITETTEISPREISLMEEDSPLESPHGFEKIQLIIHGITISVELVYEEDINGTEKIYAQAQITDAQIPEKLNTEARELITSLLTGEVQINLITDCTFRRNREPINYISTTVTSQRRGTLLRSTINTINDEDAETITIEKAVFVTLI